MAAGPSQAPPHTLRILVVEDHEDTAHALTRLLRAEGHLVTTAHTMAGALALMAGQRPVELLICDIGLRDGNGCDLLRRIREYYGGREVPAIALTARDDAGLVEECRRAGYHHFLLKPFLFEQVLEALRQVQTSLQSRRATGAPAAR